MEATLLREATLQAQRREEIDQLKQQRKERQKTSTSANFSGKQKKQQLRARKQRLTARKEAAAALDTAHDEYEEFFAASSSSQRPRQPPAGSAADDAVPLHGVSEAEFLESPDFFARNYVDLSDESLSTRLKLTVALGRHSKDQVGKELSSYFVKETKEQIHLRLLEGQLPLDLSKRDAPLRAQEMTRDALLDHPRRPAWTYRMSKETLDTNESVMFDQWLVAIHDKYEHEQLNHFEHNLEVWRELWRVTERATHVVVVTDVRNPLLHIPPSIYEFVTQELKKPMTVVLNKIDLVAPTVVSLWLVYLKKRFPLCTFVCFSSRSQAVRGDTDISARRRVLSKKLEVGDPSAIQGAIQILQSCGIDADEAQRVAEELNAPPTALELEDLLLEHSVSTDKTKRKSRRKQKHDKGTSAADAEQAAVGRRGYLLCRRCDREEHADLDNHDRVKLSAVRLTPKEQSKVNPQNAARVTIGLIGHPNVGKSSVLNALAGKKLVSVSHTPGHTKRLQSIMITPEICICDCPGLVFPFANVPKYLQELCGLYPYSQIREPYSAVRFIAEHLDLQSILGLKPRVQVFDGIEEELEWTPWTVCEAYAEKKGYRTDRRGRPDHQRAGAELIRDTVDGIVPLFFLPPDYTGDDACKTRTAQHAEDSDVGSEESEDEESDDAASVDADEERTTAAVPTKSSAAPAKVNAFSLLDSSSSEDEDSSDDDE
ncbi:hypothetical protein P43SY_002627 [Pythium insidiosum]|uniref:Guanine nucleotide-binding protein-like 1 n=1 Tax=Pythium insidiosum TaxID=114742 RepID=A0AAD5MCP2_PYTIN|nr:hypothetical protein P43SY_002627 [Pythium insidiosum]